MPKAAPPRSSWRVSRRALLWGLAFTAAAHLAMAVAMETVKPEWRDPEYGHRLKRLRHLQAAQPQRPLLLAFGSSRTQMGFSPTHMAAGTSGPIVFNYAQSGAGPLHVAVLYRRLRDAGVKPDFVLLEYMPPAFLLHEPVEQVFVPFHPKLGAADVAQLEPYCDEPSRLWGRWARTRCNPFHSMRLTLLSHWQAGWLPWPVRQDYFWTVMDPYGWTPYPLDEPAEAQREAGLGRMSRQYAAALRDFHIGRQTEQAFRDTIAACQAEGIPVATYAMPESPTFRSWYTGESARRSRAFLDALCRETGTPHFMVAADFAERDFADGHHMLRRTAERFSRTLWDEHLRRWTRN